MSNSCPKCGREWARIVENKLYCDCGYIREVNLKAHPELLQLELEKLERENQELKERIKELENIRRKIV